MNETIKTSNLQRLVIASLCFGAVLASGPAAYEGWLENRADQETQKKLVLPLSSDQHDAINKKNQLKNPEFISFNKFKEDYL